MLHCEPSKLAILAAVRLLCQTTGNDAIRVASGRSELMSAVTPVRPSGADPPN